MVTFLLFARPALAALQWAEPPPARARRARRAADAATPTATSACACGSRTGKAFATGPQGSHVLRSMALADGLVVVPRGEGRALAAGTEVELIAV